MEYNRVAVRTESQFRLPAISENILRATARFGGTIINEQCEKKRMIVPQNSQQHDPTPDGDLLRQFRRNHDEEAFAELVMRHGPLVLGVCRQILRHTHDAEDAFQSIEADARKSSQSRVKLLMISRVKGLFCRLQW